MSSHEPAHSFKKQHINPKQQTTTLTYDNNENLVQVIDIYGDSTNYSYNPPLGSLKTHTSIFGAVNSHNHRQRKIKQHKLIIVSV